MFRKKKSKKKKAGDCFPFQVVFLGSLLQKLTGSSWSWKNTAANFSSLSAKERGKSYFLFRIHLCQGRVGQLRNAESPLHGTLFCRRWSPPVVFIPFPLAPGYLFTWNFNPYWWGRGMLFSCGPWCDLCQIVEVWVWEVPPHLGASQVELEVKNLPANARDASFIFGLGRSSEVGNGNPLHYSCWEIPWTEEPGGLQSMGMQRVGHDWVQSPFLTEEEMEENAGVLRVNSI